MGYDNKLYSLSPDTSIVKRRLHSPNDVLRTSSGNEQNYGSRRRAAIPKTEEDDDAWSVECRSGRSIHSHSAQAAIKQQMKKARRIKRNTTNDYWEGLQPAELESDRYLAYRAKQRQKAKDRPDENNVWPDFLENAFQLGMLARSPDITNDALTENLTSIASRSPSRPQEGKRHL